MANIAPEEEFQTPGDYVKDSVDKGMASGMRGAWNTMREQVGGNKVTAFIKGALVMAAVAVAVVGLFGGFLGANGALEVGRQAVTTFENGMGHGLSQGFGFLFSGIGAAVVAVGGLMGMGIQSISDQHKAAARESERLAAEYKRQLEQNKGKDRHKHKQAAQNPAHTHSHEHTHTERHEHSEHHHAEHRQESRPHGGLNEDGIYVSGSVVKEKTFMAAELKRRSERETTLSVSA